MREGARDALVLSVASGTERSAFPQVADEIAQILKNELGVRIDVEVVGPGDLDPHTEIHTSPKPKRFRDER
jgi:hypothetical protein